MKNYANDGNGPTQDIHFHKQIIWHNKNILSNSKSLFYADWFNCGTVYLKDLFEDGLFLSINKIFLRLETRKGKQNLVFDYTKLKNAIPKIWLKALTRENVKPIYQNLNLKIPHFIFGKVSVLISDMKSKRFYNLISCRQTFTNRCCLYWEHFVQIDIDWCSVIQQKLNVY